MHVAFHMNLYTCLELCFGAKSSESTMKIKSNILLCIVIFLDNVVYNMMMNSAST